MEQLSTVKVFDGIQYRVLTDAGMDYYVKALTEGYIAGQSPSQKSYVVIDKSKLAYFKTLRQLALPSDTVLVVSGTASQLKTARGWYEEKKLAGTGIQATTISDNTGKLLVFLTPTDNIDLVAKIQAVAPESVVVLEPKTGWVRHPDIFETKEPNYIVAVALSGILAIGCYLLFGRTT